MLIVALIAYLLGSIPFGYILVRLFRGEDVRAIGSGNIGATNVARTGAKGLGIATLVLDASKGYVAVWVAFVLYESNTLALRDRGLYLVAGVAALCAILGHLFPVWLRFRGGKGVATGAGAFLALAPKALLIALAIFAIVFALFRYVSLGSIVATAAFPLLAYLFGAREDFGNFAAHKIVLPFTVAAAALIIAKHHQNIRRLLTGTEHRFELEHR
jgi:acyl phosphate:glycerol-3-phosphate acyltransferase